MLTNALLPFLGDRLGQLAPSAAQGMALIVSEGEARKTPLNYLAYMLATTWWETNRTFEPVREAYYKSSDFDVAEKWRKKNLDYYPFYGRGYVQLTWKRNYKKAAAKLGVDFVEDPDAAMKPEHAVKILFDGMTEGWFTNKALASYIDNVDEDDKKDLDEYFEARKVVNGIDRALIIAKAAVIFEEALKEAGYSTNPSPVTLASNFSIVLPQASAAPGSFDAHILGLGLAHFKPYEFLVKGPKNDNPNSKAHGLNTDPPENLWGNIDATARVMDKLRQALGKPIIFSSVYRSPAYNEAIAGATHSQHVDFRAIDFSVKGSSVGPQEWAGALRNIRSAGGFKGGIGVYATFVHVDTRGQNADWIG